jgi:NADPH:quinone reductase-like Zn-dependent oxidoreductase
MMVEKKIRVHIDNTYPSSQIPEAIGYIEAMHTRGKVAMVRS